MRQITRGISVTFVFASILFRNGSIFIKCNDIFGKFNRHFSGLCIFYETNARYSVKTLSIQKCLFLAEIFQKDWGYLQTEYKVGYNFPCGVIVPVVLACVGIGCISCAGVVSVSFQLYWYAFTGMHQYH